MKKFILRLSSLIGLWLIWLFIYTIYNINSNLNFEFWEGNNSEEVELIIWNDICSEDTCDKNWNILEEADNKQISLNNKLEVLNKEEDKINLKQENNNKKILENQDISLDNLLEESDLNKDKLTEKTIKQDNKNQENAKILDKEIYITSNQEFLKIITKLEKIENWWVILLQNSLLNIEYWSKNVFPKEIKNILSKESESKSQVNINKEQNNLKEEDITKGKEEKENKKDNITEENKNKENKNIDHKALLNAKKANPNLIPKKVYWYSEFINSQYYTSGKIASDERYGFYSLAKDKPEILTALKQNLTIEQDWNILETWYRVPWDFKNNVSSFSIYEIISKDLTNKNLDYLIKEDKLLLQAEKWLGDKLKLDRYTKIKDNRTVFIEEFAEWNYRCMYWSDRLNDKYIVMYSGCGLKDIYTLDSRLFFSDFYLKNKLKSLDRDRLNDIKHNKFPYFYSFENSIRQYDEDWENIIANIIKKDSEIITTFSNKKLNCSQALDLPVLLCVWEYPWAKLEWYKLLFLNTNKYISLENNEKEDYVWCYFDNQDSISFTENKKEIMTDCYFDWKVVTNQFFDLNGKFLREEELK